MRKYHIITLLLLGILSTRVYTVELNFLSEKCIRRD